MSVAVGLGGKTSIKTDIQLHKKVQKTSIEKEAIFLEKFQSLNSFEGIALKGNQNQRNFTFIAGKSGDLAVNVRMIDLVSDFFKKEQTRQPIAVPEKVQSETYYKQYLQSVIFNPKFYVRVQSDCDFVLRGLSYELLKAISQDFQTVLNPTLEKLNYRDRLYFFETVKKIHTDSSLSSDSKRRWIASLPALHAAIGFLNVGYFFNCLKKLDAKDLPLLVKLIVEQRKSKPLEDIAELDINAIIFEIKNNPSSKAEDVAACLKRISSWKIRQGFLSVWKGRNYYPSEEILTRVETLFSRLPKESDVPACVVNLFEMSKCIVGLDFHPSSNNHALEFNRLAVENMEKLIHLFTDHLLDFNDINHFLGVFTTFSNFCLNDIELIVKNLYQFNREMLLNKPLREGSSERLDLQYFLCYLKFFKKIDRSDIHSFFKNVQFSYRYYQTERINLGLELPIYDFYKGIFKPLVVLYIAKQKKFNHKIISELNRIISFAGYEPFSLQSILNDPEDNIKFMCFYREVYEMTEPQFSAFSKSAINFSEQFKDYIKNPAKDLFQKEILTHLKKHSDFVKYFQIDWIENNPSMKSKLDELLKIINEHKKQIKDQGKELPDNHLQLLDDVFLKNFPKKQIKDQGTELPDNHLQLLNDVF